MDNTEAVSAVERVEEFAVSPEELWDAITDPDLLAEWFGPVDIDLVPDGTITSAEPGGPGAIGVVEVVQAPDRLEFVWIAPGTNAPSSVEIVIDRNAEGGSTLHVREVLIDPDWERRPAWFASARPGSARVRIGFHA
jgi:uncharacterized protein YndB with AHSA1/START domain